MNESDAALADALRQAQFEKERGRVPDFQRVWSAAESKAQSIRRRRVVFAGAAAAVAVVALVVRLLPGDVDDWHYIDPNDLLETTQWSAPSDSLLPDHQFDIYQDIPLIPESTETYGGALL